MTRTIVVSGIRSGCGKTSVALGLMAALRARGLVVQPFKVGPDFIDPGLHELVCGRPSHNLDGWMCTRHAVEEIFSRNARGADVAVVEGVMGLFDGFSGDSDEGSTAEIAKWLDAPVLLVADASSMARSAAALVKGFAAFDPDIRMAGALFNRVASDNHRSLLEQAMASLDDIRAAGFLPKREEIKLPSRHLGLVTAEEGGFGPDHVKALAAWLESAVDIPALLESLPKSGLQPVADHRAESVRVRIAVARDKAFCFYYRENLRLLEECGAELVSFSPLDGKRLPPDVHGLYLGRGYPEVHGLDLSNNTSMRKDIKAFVESGRPVLAECGGFMYLMRSLTTVHGQTCQMAGVFPFRASMNEKRSALGYRNLITTADSVLGPAGTIARGHEFHYSSIPEEAYAEAGLFQVMNRRGPLERGEGFVRKNVVGSYIHIHFSSNPDLARHFVEACCR